MRQIFIKELSAYTTEGLKDILGVSYERAAQCIEVLTTRSVLCLRSGSDEEVFDVEKTQSYRGKYQFVYVGLTIVGDESATGESLTIIVYPKYMDEKEFQGNNPSAQTLAKLRQIFQVLRKSQGSYSDIATLTESSKRFNNRIACILMIIEMYAEYGEYSNYVRTLNTNGAGNISWERTIALHQPVLQEGTPIYFDCETIASTKDDADFITRMHKCILTECSAYLRNSGVADILGLEEIELTDESLEDLGETEHLLYRLDRERAVQYVTWKQDVIDLMKRYITKEEMVIDSDEIICLGTNSFYHVWEKACKTSFGDKLDKRIGNLGFKLCGKWPSRKNETLLDIVPSPRWSKQPYDGVIFKPQGTLIPDIVTMLHTPNGESVFSILDAKYYEPEFRANGSVCGAPGVGDVTKQVLYQQAYKDFIKANGFSRVINAFLVPFDSQGFELMGHVEFPDVFEPEEEPFVNGVDMWKLPAERIWQCYLNGEALSDDLLDRLFFS